MEPRDIDLLLRVEREVRQDFTRCPCALCADVPVHHARLAVIDREVRGSRVGHALLCQRHRCPCALVRLREPHHTRGAGGRVRHMSPRVRVQGSPAPVHRAPPAHERVHKRTRCHAHIAQVTKRQRLRAPRVLDSVGPCVHGLLPRARALGHLLDPRVLREHTDLHERGRGRQEHIRLTTEPRGRVGRHKVQADVAPAINVADRDVLCSCATQHGTARGVQQGPLPREGGAWIAGVHRRPVHGHAGGQGGGGQVHHGVLQRVLNRV